MRLNKEVQRNDKTQVLGQVAGRPEIATTNKRQVWRNQTLQSPDLPEKKFWYNGPCYLVTMVNIVALYYCVFVRTISLQIFVHVPFHGYRGPV
jgi:hypothetical protein